VIRIGALAQMYHLDQSSMGLNGAVSHILQSLTPDERRSIAQGNAIPPRIEAMVTAEAEAAKATAAQAEAAQHNASGAPLSAAAMAALGLTGGFAGGGQGRSDSGGSSARYDTVAAGTNGDWSGSAGQAYMRQFAIDKGVGWAANNPDLLRLGPSAIQAIADVNLRPESYHKLQDNAGFSAGDVVKFAKFAKKKKIDANAASDAIGEVGEGLNREEKKKLHDGVMPYIGKPEDRKAHQRANDAFEKVRKDHPEKGDAVDRAKEKLQLKVEQTAKAEANARAEDHKVDDSRAQMAELFKNRQAAKTPKPGAN
jgi:hypothetical protein